MATSRGGSTYLVTGGASGLGLATARLLASQGANVAIGDTNVAAGRSAAEDLGPACLFVELDVTRKASCRVAVAACVERFGSLSGVVNCAGTGSAVPTLDRKLEPHGEEVWDAIMRINVYGTFYCASEGASAMARQPTDAEGCRGVIVNVASVAAFEGTRGQLAYAASKSAVVGMTLPMARDLARQGIRVVCIAPGPIDTPLLRTRPPEALAASAAMVPWPRRLGRAEEFAQLVAAVIDNGYLNGETIRLDGGIRLANL